MIRGPLHVQCGGHGDEGVLRQLVQQVIAWPGIEAEPLPIGSADLVSLRLAEDFATDDPFAFIDRRCPAAAKARTGRTRRRSSRSSRPDR